MTWIFTSLYKKIKKKKKKEIINKSTIKYIVIINIINISLQYSSKN